MRINVSAEAWFFADKRYPSLERLLAAAAAGCMSVNAVRQGGEIDVQVNPVVMASTIGQYVFSPKTDGKKFQMHRNGRSMVTIEIDHVNEQTGGDHEQLLCNIAVVLVRAIYGVWQNQNCWSKLYGGATADTGWCEVQFQRDAIKLTVQTIERFANSEITADVMVATLREPLIDIWKD
jgi:hypothetical protein